MKRLAVACALAVGAFSASADVRQFLVVGGQDFGKAEFERLYLRDILFDGVRVHDSRPGEQLIDVRTKVISEGGLPACHCDSAGTIRGLVFRNIRSAPDMGVGLQAHDDAHPIEGVVFENVDGLSRPFVKGKVDWTVRPL